MKLILKSTCTHTHARWLARGNVPELFTKINYPNKLYPVTLHRRHCEGLTYSNFSSCRSQNFYREGPQCTFKNPVLVGYDNKFQKRWRRSNLTVKLMKSVKELSLQIWNIPSYSYRRWRRLITYSGGEQAKRSIIAAKGFMRVCNFPAGESHHENILRLNELEALNFHQCNNSLVILRVVGCSDRHVASRWCKYNRRF
jgi:hypothetical protein